jgi:hypothetical protein
MKPSTVKWLSKAIALPLFMATLNIATTAGAEQIDRSQTSTSIGTSNVSTKHSIPAVTDLNLTIPVAATELPADNRDRANLGDSNISSDRQNNLPITVRAQSGKAKSRSKPRSIVAENTNISTSLTGEQTSKNKSITRRRNLVATNINSSTEAIAKHSQKLKSSSRQKLAAVSPPPLSGNYLRLVRDPNKGTNDIGNPIYTLEAYVDGQRYQTFNAVSGTATTQTADRHRGNNFAPLPDGSYNVSNRIVPGNVSEVGRTFIGIFPKFETRRNDLGIHLDLSFNKRNGYDGTAGCIGMTTTVDRDAINEFVTKYRPHNLFVSISSPANQQ